MAEYPSVHDNDISLLKKIATNTAEVSDGTGGGGGGSGSAASTTYDNSTSGLTATDLQEAIDEAVDLIEERLVSIETTVADGQVVVYNGTGGKSGKKATGTGVAALASGVLGVVTIGSGLSYVGSTLSATGGAGGSKTLARWGAWEGQPPALNFATLDTRNSRKVADFDASTEESLLFLGKIPEGADLSSGIRRIVEWKTTSATSGNIGDRGSFERGNTDSDADSFAAGIESAATAVNGTTGISTFVTTDHTSGQIDGVAVGDSFYLKITRNTSAASNHAGDAELVSVELQQIA
jgi:hypothetical protein